ncbi:hypothetical protein Tco_1391135 [Tanacetum coccineum]
MAKYQSVLLGKALQEQQHESVLTRPINTAAPKPFVNVAKTRPNAFQKSHSLSRRLFYQQTALKNINLNDRVNTAKVNSINTAKGSRVTSAIREQRINAVKSSTYWVWRPKIKVLDHISKNSGSYSCLELQDKKELAIPGQTATGKEFLNPLMASSLPKTITYLEKNDENAEFHQIVDFLSTCSINYALTQIHAIVDGKVVVISESSVRSDLLFNDEDGVTCLTNDEIFENLALMGYEQLSTKLTFQKSSFSPQWKFLIHTILHCISSKSTALNEFSTNLPSAVICLAKGQNFNLSKLIFDGMLRNLDSKKFLLHPSFL